MIVYLLYALGAIVLITVGGIALYFDHVSEEFVKEENKEFEELTTDFYLQGALSCGPCVMKDESTMDQSNDVTESRKLRYRSEGTINASPVPVELGQLDDNASDPLNVSITGNV
jgi:hypothetical protein